MAKKPLDYNYAKDREFSEELTNKLLELWNLVKSNRDEREERWKEAYRAWSIDREDYDKGYIGRSNLYMPQLRKEVETMTRRIQKGLFPEDYLRAEPTRFENEDLCLVNTQVVRHYLDNKMNFKAKSQPWIKQGVLYGTSPLRTFWKKEVNEQFLRERYFVVRKDGILEPKLRKVQKSVTLYDAPYTRCEDIFNTWVYPHSAQSKDEIEIVFFKTIISDEELKKMEKRGELCHLEEIKEQGRESIQLDEDEQERSQQFAEDGRRLATPDNKLYEYLECWLKVALPGEDCLVPVVVGIINEQLACRVQRNPYWHQEAPFNFFRFIIPPGREFYGRGLPEASISMQHQLNDTLNQGMDSATIALNPIAIVNPAFAPNADSFEFEPARTWWADPNAVKFSAVPDLSDIAIKNAGMIRGMITEMSDNSPQLPDPIAGKARSTGQAELAINEWQTDLFIFIETCGYEAMAPFAKQVHQLIQQNVSDEDIIRITGKYAGTWINRIVTPEEIVGGFDFRWMGSIQIESQAIKNQQMMNLLKLYPTLPPDAQAQIKLLWPNIMIKLFRDGFGIKDFQNIVETPDLNPSTPPNIEDRLMKQGGMVKVNKSDDDELHIKSHEFCMNELDPKKDVYLRAVLAKHIAEHRAQQAQKQAEIKQVQMMMLAQGGRDMQNQGRGPGNTTQIPEATERSDLDRGMRG